MKKFVTLLLLLSIYLIKGQAQDTLKKSDTVRLKETIITYQADKVTPVTYLNISSKDLKSKSTGQEPSFILSVNSCRPIKIQILICKSIVTEESC